ncbi:MAG: hypothetical protein WCP91_03835 [Candidatus Berkelbacteria bacterium]
MVDGAERKGLSEEEINQMETKAQEYMPGGELADADANDILDQSENREIITRKRSIERNFFSEDQEAREKENIATIDEAREEAKHEIDFAESAINSLKQMSDGDKEEDLDLALHIDEYKRRIANAKTVLESGDDQLLLCWYLRKTEGDMFASAVASNKKS